MGDHAPRLGAYSQPTGRELGSWPNLPRQGQNGVQRLGPRGQRHDGTSRRSKVGADQDEDGDVIKGLDRVWVREKRLQIKSAMQVRSSNTPAVRLATLRPFWDS